MNRITWFSINDKPYPLNLSMKATRLISERFGGMEHVADALGDGGVEEALEVVSWLLALLMQQGFAYCDLTGTERPEKRFSQEELEILLQPADIPELKNTLFSAMANGVNREIYTEDNEKNEETTQG